MNRYKNMGRPASNQRMDGMWEQQCWISFTVFGATHCHPHGIFFERELVNFSKTIPYHFLAVSTTGKTKTKCQRALSLLLAYCNQHYSHDNPGVILHNGVVQVESSEVHDGCTLKRWDTCSSGVLKVTSGCFWESTKEATYSPQQTWASLA